jgi:tetratricopeptide (TPR) repeat protein
LCQQLTWYWYACGYPEEGRRWLERATQRVKGEEPEEINVLHGLGVILLQQGESETARQLFTRCLRYYRRRGDDSQTARELNSLGIAYRYTDEHDKARELFDEGIPLAERSGDKSRLASLLSNLGVWKPMSGPQNQRSISSFDRSVGHAVGRLGRCPYKRAALRDV